MCLKTEETKVWVSDKFGFQTYIFQTFLYLLSPFYFILGKLPMNNAQLIIQFVNAKKCYICTTKKKLKILTAQKVLNVEGLALHSITIQNHSYLAKNFFLFCILQCGAVIFDIFCHFQ